MSQFFESDGQSKELGHQLVWETLVPVAAALRALHVFTGLPPSVLGLTSHFLCWKYPEFTPIGADFFQ